MPCRYFSPSIRPKASEKHYICIYVTDSYMIIENLDIVKRLIDEKENGQVEFKETTGQLRLPERERRHGAVRCERQGKDYRTGSERQDQTGYGGGHQPTGAGSNGTNILCSTAGQ